MATSWEAVVQTVVNAKSEAPASGLAPVPFFDSIDQRLRKLVDDVEKEFTLGTPPPHEPALAEPLLGDIATLLDRCAAYQREASELEIKWVQYRLESDLTRDLADLELRVAVAGLGKETAKAAQSAHADTAIRFAGANAEPLAAGFAKEAEGASAVASKALDVASERESLLEERTQKLRDFQASLNARHLAPGGAHNYLERYERVCALMFEDFEEAYRKAKCVVLGLQFVFDLTPKEVQLPAFADAKHGPVFELILWTRRMMRKIELLSESEAEHELVVPLLQPFRDAARGLITKDEYTTAMKDGGTGTLNVTLPDALFANQARVRVKGVGLSFVIPNLADMGQMSERMLITLFPPLQDLPSGQRRRPGIVLGTVLPYGSQTVVVRADGLTVHNIKPAGEWRILIHPLLVSGGVTAMKRAETNPIDLRLHLNVVSAPNPDPTKWKVGA